MNNVIQMTTVPDQAELLEIMKQRNELLEACKAVTTIPWDSSLFIGFSDEQIAKIKHGFDYALNQAHWKLAPAIAKAEASE